MSEKTHVGVSGFSYPSWKGKFYPDDLKEESFLGYYSSRLNTVEINSSFYAQPSAAAVKGWGEKTEESFRFAFKAPRLITHILKLGKGASDAAAKLSKTVDALGPRLGPILFQLPPYSKQDLVLLGAFLSETSSMPDRVFEFRHQSWLDESTFSLLEKNGSGFCIAETEEMKPVLKVTGETAYFRLRLDSYDAAAIDRWAKEIPKLTKGTRETYVYLRHDESGENAVLAQRLHDKLLA